MTNCMHCGGAVRWDREDARDAPLLKCIACGRAPAPPRAHEEPARRESTTSTGGRVIDTEEYYKRSLRSERERKARKKERTA